MATVDGVSKQPDRAALSLLLLRDGTTDDEAPKDILASGGADGGASIRLNAKDQKQNMAVGYS